MIDKNKVRIIKALANIGKNSTAYVIKRTVNRMIEFSQCLVVNSYTFKNSDNEDILVAITSPVRAFIRMNESFALEGLVDKQEVEIVEEFFNVLERVFEVGLLCVDVHANTLEEKIQSLEEANQKIYNDFTFLNNILNEIVK